MEIIKFVVDFIIHVDKYLQQIIDLFGVWAYVILFLIIFIETGIVLFPFLPGDSLIFTAGAFAGLGFLNVIPLYLVFLVAAILGDTVNYFIGKKIGKRAFTEESKFFKKRYLLKAEAFYEKHGGKAIILSRFVPIVRTFAPFVAGIGNMEYLKFLSYNIIGGFSWVTIFTFGGYALGNVEIIKNNIQYSAIIIIAISLIPVFWEIIKSKREKRINNK